MLNKKALAASVSAPPATFVEDVFSTFLYTGNSSTQNINNGIDLTGKGGLVWLKRRSEEGAHNLYDTTRGNLSILFSNLTNSEYTDNGNFSFNSSGFGFTGNTDGGLNFSGITNCSWTFAEQPKFFDVVTYTGNGANRTIAHNLGSVPGMIIVKRTDTTGDWQVYHRANTANPETDYLVLNSTAATADSDTRWNDTQPTSSVFSLGTEATVNASGGTYVAYLFAHNAGGFGTSGTDNVISCGSFTTDGAGSATINLGYEPQYLMYKRSSGVGDWFIVDTMRGFTSNADSSIAALYANLSNAEAVRGGPAITSTGFITQEQLASSSTYIYMAIRRPMKVPTTGTQVFSPTYVPTISAGTKSTTGFPIDLQILSYATGTTENQTFVDRLRGVSTTATEGGRYLISSSTAAESGTPAETLFWDNTGFQQHSYFGGGAARYWNFRRASGFFDEICYTGNSVLDRQLPHNLGVKPDLVIYRSRSNLKDWYVYNSTLTATKYIRLNTGGQAQTASWFLNDVEPTSTYLSVSNDDVVNQSGWTYVAYLFATLAGVSKVGSYTGTGTAQTINCGFTAGARFVMIKRTDSTGDWYVWDTARGIVSGNDPYLLMNSTAAEVTNTDYIDPLASGFEISSTAPAAINASGGAFIFLAIA
jgi:hypothetical protein